MIKLGSAISCEHHIPDVSDGAAEASSFSLVSTNVKINANNIEWLAVVLIWSTGANGSIIC